MRGEERAKPLDAVGYGAVRVLILAARLLPWCVMRAVGILVGRLGYRLDSRHRKIALESVRLSFPDRGEAEHQAIVKGCYRHIGLSVVEFAMVASLPREAVKKLWAVTGEQAETITELVGERPAPIFVTGHVGLWEMCGLGHTAWGWPLASIARPLDNSRINGLVDSVRERFGQRILAKRGALVAALHSLKQGVPVAMLLDQNAGKYGVFVPLFGRAASTLTTAAEIALRTGAPIVCVTSWRDEAHGVHRLRLGRIIRPGQWAGPRDERYAAEVRRITAAYTQNIEDAVREHPDQWLWLHRRWKTRPAEEGSAASADDRMRNSGEVTVSRWQ